MGSWNVEGSGLEMFEVGPCETAHQMGFLVGRRFSKLIRSRLARDLVLQNQLLPFAQTPQSQPLLQALSYNNQNKFPRYWEELLGIAEGSGVPVLHVGPPNKIVSHFDVYHQIVLCWSYSSCSFADNTN